MKPFSPCTSSNLLASYVVLTPETELRASAKPACNQVLAINELLKAYPQLTCMLAHDPWLLRLDIKPGNMFLPDSFQQMLKKNTCNLLKLSYSVSFNQRQRGCTKPSCYTSKSPGRWQMHSASEFIILNLLSVQLQN